MRLYSLSKRHFVLVFVVFLICFGLTVFVGVAGERQNRFSVVTCSFGLHHYEGVHRLQLKSPTRETPYTK